MLFEDCKYDSNFKLKYAYICVLYWEENESRLVRSEERLGQKLPTLLFEFEFRGCPRCSLDDAFLCMLHDFLVKFEGCND